MNRTIASSLLVCAISLVAGQPVVAVTIDTVHVGDVGNANDPFTGNSYGGVSYAYNIGKYEVTVGQYTAFLNAVAATDTYGLYNPLMAANLNTAGIAQSGALGSYTYSVIGSANKPVTFVSWGDAARFSNWLNNGQPTGTQGPGTTETGAYTLNGATSNVDLYSIVRNGGAQWLMPTENEWYKAAYYDPRSAAQGGPPENDNYWNFPMTSNAVPYSDQPPGSGAPAQSETANFFKNDGIANGYDDGYAVTGSTSNSPSQNYLTDVGAYTSSTSPYGTFDQGGNVWEWNETPLELNVRGFRGGFFDGLASTMNSFYWAGFPPASEMSNIGFRVALVPEPSTFILAAFGVAGLAAYGWRKRQPKFLDLS